MAKTPEQGHRFRRSRIRKRIKGTPERPRLSVARSIAHIYAQVIDDAAGKTLAFASTREKDVPKGTKTQRAAWVGGEIAKRALAVGVKKAVFDRGGRQYHGRVKAVADGARKAGLEF